VTSDVVVRKQGERWEQLSTLNFWLSVKRQKIFFSSENFLSKNAKFGAEKFLILPNVNGKIEILNTHNRRCLGTQSLF